MSVFKTKCFLMLRDPRGGVEDLDRMQAAGFEGVFCNIGDHHPEEWEAIVRPRALQRGMFCGPWARTERDGAFSESVLSAILDIAQEWASPLIVNSEAELKGSGGELTSLIAERCAGYDAALSMEPVPFDNVSWVPLAEMPVLPQYFSALFDPGSIEWATDLWHGYGIKCVFPTFGTYGGSTPGDYSLNAPYSLYTADDCGGNYAAWSPTAHSYVGCVEDGGDDVQVIGTDDGVKAEYNALRDLDPSRTLLVKEGNKWPDISTLTQPLSEWKAWDKAQRRAQILVDDHDELAQTRADARQPEEPPAV
jgi:hypothetical protein